MNPSLEELNNIRRYGYRPSFVAGFVSNKKVLFVYEDKYKLWQLFQGGIKSGEKLDQALLRNCDTELGKGFSRMMGKEIVMLDNDRAEFESKKNEELELDDGSKVKMIGKFYYLLGIPVMGEEIDMRDSIFEVARWCVFDEAMNISETIYQESKKRIILKTIHLLKENQMLN